MAKRSCLQLVPTEGKYNIAKPTYSKWASTGIRFGLPQHGFAAILLKRAFVFGYMAFASEMMISLEQQEAESAEGLEITPIDWESVWMEVRKTGPDIWYGTCREWVTEGIRIFYERQAYESWDRRTMWKVLKSPSMSACRKLCRAGAWGVARVFVTFLRGDLLQYAADATVRALLLPLRMRHSLLKSPRPPAQAIARAGAKHAVLEGALVLTKYVTTATATTFFIAGTFLVSVKIFGAERSVSQYDNDSKLASTFSMALCLGAGGLVGDMAESMARAVLASMLHIESPGPMAPIEVGNEEPDLHFHAA